MSNNDKTATTALQNTGGDEEQPEVEAPQATKGQKGGKKGGKAAKVKVLQADTKLTKNFYVCMPPSIRKILPFKHAQKITALVDEDEGTVTLRLKPKA